MTPANRPRKSPRTRNSQLALSRDHSSALLTTAAFAQTHPASSSSSPSISFASTTRSASRRGSPSAASSGSRAKGRCSRMRAIATASTFTGPGHAAIGTGLHAGGKRDRRQQLVRARCAVRREAQWEWYFDDITAYSRPRACRRARSPPRAMRGGRRAARRATARTTTACRSRPERRAACRRRSAPATRSAIA